MPYPQDVNLIGTTEIDPPAFEQVQDWPATSRPLCPDSAPELAEPSAAVLGREGKKEAAGAKASGTGNSRPHRARHCETESNGPGHPCSVGLELPLYSVHKAQVGILVVDDTSTVRHLLAHAVKRMGYDVDTARTGEVRGGGNADRGASPRTMKASLESAQRNQDPTKRHSGTVARWHGGGDVGPKTVQRYIVVTNPKTKESPALKWAQK